MPQDAVPVMCPRWSRPAGPGMSEAPGVAMAPVV